MWTRLLTLPPFDALSPHHSSSHHKYYGIGCHLALALQIINRACGRKSVSCQKWVFFIYWLNTENLELISIRKKRASGGRFTKLQYLSSVTNDRFFFKATEILASDRLSADLSLIFVIWRWKKALWNGPLVVQVKALIQKVYSIVGRAFLVLFLPKTHQV